MQTPPLARVKRAFALESPVDIRLLYFGKSISAIFVIHKKYKPSMHKWYNQFRTGIRDGGIIWEYITMPRMQICITLQRQIMNSKHPATYEEKFHERTR